MKFSAPLKLSDTSDLCDYGKKRKNAKKLEADDKPSQYG